jgi:hypothetical protein
MQMLDQMNQPNPQAQMAQEAAMQTQQAQVADLTTKAQKQAAEAQKIQVETALMPEKMRVDIVQAASTNLNQGDDFERRLKVADLLLKEKNINLKEADIASNERIASLQSLKKML